MANVYSEDFKAEAVALALESDRSNSEIALDLGVSKSTFNTWVRQAMKAKQYSKDIKTPPTKQDYQSLERELRAARKELELRKKEIDFLKKTSAYFASQPK